MSLLISQNKKDVSIHQALWNLQGFDFMTFSDKFQTINLHEILNLHPDDQYDHNNDPENETVEKNVDLKDMNTVSNQNNRVQKIDVDMSVLKKDN